MMGEAIAARALGDAGRRLLPNEQLGPRPAAVRANETNAAAGERRTVTATKP